MGILERLFWPLGLAVLLSCGGGGGSSGSTLAGERPSLANLQLSPSSVVQNQGGGTVTLTASFDFQDAGGNLSDLYLSDGAGQTLSLPIQGADGITGGTLQLYLYVHTDVIGRYAFDLWVDDAFGLASNSLTGTFEVQPDDTATSWSIRSLPGGYSGTVLEAVAWSGSQFVAVGGGGAILTSPDGATWSGQASPTTLDLHGVAWAGGTYVAVGDQGTTLTSGDGINWTSHPTDGGLTLQAVAGSGSRWVAVGWRANAPPALDSEVILSSTDAATWTPSPATGNGYLFGVHWNGSSFLAVGEQSGSVATGRIYGPSDGLTWGPPLDPSSMYLTTATSDGSGWVASGPSCPALHSTDGLAWTATGIGAMVGSRAIGWSGRRFLAGGVAGTGNTSTDGVNGWP
jgi:hypothetical protein